MRNLMSNKPHCFMKIFLMFLLAVMPVSEVSSAGGSLGEIVSLNTEEEGRGSIISIESTRPFQYTAFKLLNPLRLVLDFPEMDQGSLTSNIQVNKGFVKSIRPVHFKEAGVLRLEIVLNQPVDYEIKKQNKNKLMVSLLSSERLQNEEMAQSSPVNSLASEVANKEEVVADGLKDDGNRDTCFPMLYGEKETISLDFQNADVRNFFRTFSEISGFNIIISPEVSGTLSIRLNDVPWNEALEIALSNINLGRECFDNNFVRIASNTVLAAEESERVAEKARSAAERANEQNAQALVTEVIRVNNANITTLAANLNALKSSRTDAQITVDIRTNTLILNDLRKHVNDMLETIRVLDVPTAQVAIESKIVNITKTYAQRLGIQWGVTRPVTGAGTGVGQTIGVTGSDGDGDNFIVELGKTFTAGSTSGFGLTLGNFINGAGLNIALQALETDGKTRILSSPRVVVADNKEARISSGKQIPYQVTTAEGNSIDFANAELSLTVVPHVTSDDRIYMTIDTTKNSVDETVTVQGVPVISTKETHTEVLVGDGDTTVLAGLYESTIDEKTSKVPLFSEIPLLGYLFRNYEDTDTLGELMVFITPTIVKMN
ncbi:MAG: type IV pilus secretin PilQ [Nitrospinae bacterium]|nr:type IV pilus secretin PilQ [Nitrospinota bacterium]